ncbi:MAG TPA: Ig-like domain-containing protein [Longimicrobiales bacterium]|nr:Ig-like domain-containing protein [Longimicrobiales bacterium]
MTAPTGAPHFAISDGKNGGTTGFYFLPPLVAPPKATGTFDPALQPEISVCALTGGACGAEVAHFTMTSTPAVTLDLAGEAYTLQWQTAPLAAGSQYRVQVSVGSLQLGYLDLAVVSKGGEVKSVPSGFVGVVQGHPISLKFRIETGIAPTLTIAPGSALVGIGVTSALTAAMTDLHGNTIPISDPVTWSSSSPAVTVSDAGVVTGVTPGEATVTATVSGMKATAKVEVVPDLMVVVGHGQLVDNPEFWRVRAGTAPVLVKTIVAGEAITGLSWSPDGSKLAFSTQPGGTPNYAKIMTMNADGTGLVQLTSNPNQIAWWPTWSPDGGRIAFISRGGSFDNPNLNELWVMDSDGGNSHRLFTDYATSFNNPAWSPDGAHIAQITWHAELQMLDADGSNPTMLLDVPEPDGAFYRPSWSPDSKTLVVETCPFLGCALSLIDVATKARTVLLAGEWDGSFNSPSTAFSNPDWSPDGRRIAYIRQDQSPTKTSWSVEMIRPDGSDRVTLWTIDSGYPGDLKWRPW